MQIAVIGAGSWGTTLADLLARNGHEVRIWAYEPEVVETINRDHVNQMFLADSRIAESVLAVPHLAEAVRGAELVVSAAPSHAVRDVSQTIAGALDGDLPPTVVSVSKGLETDSLKIMTEVLGETLPASDQVPNPASRLRSDVHSARLHFPL